MEYKEFLQQLSQITGRPQEAIAADIAAIASTISSFCTELDSVAVPGFGTFQPVKTEERFVAATPTEPARLVPPSITVRFKSSVVLRKSLS